MSLAGRQADGTTVSLAGRQAGSDARQAGRQNDSQQAGRQNDSDRQAEDN